MRRENAGCVTWRNWAEREKLRVSAKLTKSSSHLVSTMTSVARWGRRPIRLDADSPMPTGHGVEHHGFKSFFQLKGNVNRLN